MGIPRVAHPYPRERASKQGPLNTTPTSLKGTGNKGVSPKALSALKLLGMDLDDPLPGMLRSLAESHPFHHTSVFSGLRAMGSWRLQ